MALVYRPHTFTVERKTQKKRGSDSAALPPTTDTTRTIRGMMTPTRPSVEFGQLDPEVANPHFLYVNLEDADSFRVGDKVTYGSRIFYVRIPPRRADAIPDISHAVAVVEESEVG